MPTDYAPGLLERTDHAERTEREVQAIEQVIQRLRETFPQVPAGQIEATVDAQLHHFDHSRIRDYVPIFVERNAREALMGAGRPR